MIHHVYANRSNIGDWLSARGIQQLLAPHAIVEHLCDEPFVPQTLAALRQARAGDVIVVGGGGLFMDYFDPFWQGLAALESPAALCLWGLGYCDLKRQPSHPRMDVVQAIVARSELCVVRDELSRRYLALPGVATPVPCPSLCAVEPVTPGHGLLHVDNYSTVGAEVYEAMDAIGRDFAQRTGRRYRQTNNRVDRVNEREMQERLRRYRLSDCVISSALHGCIISVAMGLPVIAVSGDTKIEGFMEAAGLLDWVLDVDEVQRLPELLERLERQPAVPGFVAAAREANRKVAQAVLEIAAARRSRVEAGGAGNGGGEGGADGNGDGGGTP